MPAASKEEGRSPGSEAGQQGNLGKTLRQGAVVLEQRASALDDLGRVVAAQIEGTMHEPPLAVRGDKPQHPALAARHPLSNDAATPSVASSLPR